MAKLTLNIDSEVVLRAKTYARLRGVPLSRMVEDHLAAVTGQSADDGVAAPVLRSLRGMLQHADVAKYRAHLESKYR